jgi:type I site-specific restriction endonuclease
MTAVPTESPASRTNEQRMIGSPPSDRQTEGLTERANLPVSVWTSSPRPSSRWLRSHQWLDASVVVVAAIPENSAARPSRACAQRTPVTLAGMNLDNFLVRPHRRSVERFSSKDAWSSLTTDDNEEALTLSGLPSASRDEDEEAKRFDLLMLRRQLAQLDGDVVAAERLRETVQAIASALLAKTAIPSSGGASSAARCAGWRRLVDRRHPAHAGTGPAPTPRPRQVRRAVWSKSGLHRLRRRSQRQIEIDLPGVTPGTNPERFRAKAAAYLREHEDHLALQRLRRTCSSPRTTSRRLK